MRNVILVMMVMIFIPMAYANSGQVAGPILGVGIQDFDDDDNSGTPALTDHAWLQFDTGAINYDGDADNDTNTYDTECAYGYFKPIWFNLTTDKGRAMYSTATSATLSGYMLVIAYTQNADDICVADDLFIVAPM